MNCEQMSLLLSAWLDGELSVREEEQMRAHLEQCPDCRALMEQLQTLHASFSDLEEIPAPDGFADRVMDRVARESKPRVVPLFKRPQFRSLAALAACAVLCIGFGRISMGGSAKSEPAPAAPAPEAAVAPVMEPAAPASESTFDSSMILPDVGIYEASVEKSIGGAPESPAEVPAPIPPRPYEPEEPCETEGTAVLTPGAEMLCPDAAPAEENCIELSELPDGLEEAVGELLWEERVEDGALCARLTANQAEQVLELIRMQGLDSVCVGFAGADGDWSLVLLQN